MYKEIDKILLSWLKKYGLHVFTKYRDDEVRTFYVVDDIGDTYQVMISPLDTETKKIHIHFGIRKKKKAEYKGETIETSLSGFENALEETYRRITIWIEEFGHTRTPVL
jgi:transcriptional accessory protein Tex/SPT6